MNSDTREQKKGKKKKINWVIVCLEMFEITQNTPKC